MHTLLSRRAILSLGMRSAAGAGLLGAVPAAEALAFTASASKIPVAAGGSKVLVCLYFFGGAGETLGSGDGVHASLADLQPLAGRQQLAVLPGVASTQPFFGPSRAVQQKYAGLRFLPGGYATLDWAAEAAGVTPITGEGAYTFSGGTTLVAIGNRIPGDQYENATIRKATASVAPHPESFPDTLLGRQLADVGRLLQVRDALGMSRQVFFIGIDSPSRRHGKDRVEQYRDLAKSLAAFHELTVRLGVADHVTAYTDGERPSGHTSSFERDRIVLGAAAGALSGARGLSQDRYLGAMVTSFGLHARAVQQFPGFASV